MNRAAETAVGGVARRAAAIIAALWPFAVAALWLALMFPWGAMVSLEQPDEGFNGQQAMLYGQGYRFYTDMWLDQPTLPFIALSRWFRWFGATLWSGRSLIFLTSVLLAGCLYHTARLRAGRVAAGMTLLLLITGEAYIWMSMTLIQAIPALAFAILSLLLLTLCRRRFSHLLLAASAVAMALSLHLKLIGGILAPLLAADLFWHPRPARRATWVDPLLWCGIVGASFLALGWATGVDWHALFFSHAVAQTTSRFASGAQRVPRFLVHNYYLALLALPALARAIRNRDREQLVPLGWLLLTLLLLYRHKPVWGHYEIMLTVPLSWAAGLGAAICAGPTQRGRGLLVVIAAAVCFQLPGIRDRLRYPPTRLDPETLAMIREYAPRTHWIVAIDCQTYAFAAGLTVPPEIASTPEKRYLVKAISASRVGELIERYRPEQVLLDTLYPLPAPTTDFLLTHYRARFPGGNFIQWVRRDLAPAADGWAEDPAGEVLLIKRHARAAPFEQARWMAESGRPREALRILDQALTAHAPSLLRQREAAAKLRARLGHATGAQEQPMEFPQL